MVYLTSYLCYTTHSLVICFPLSEVARTYLNMPFCCLSLYAGKVQSLPIPEINLAGLPIKDKMFSYHGNLVG